MKIALITGGSRGVGKSVALNVAKRSTGVILTYNTRFEEANEVVAEIKKSGGNAVALQLDVGKSKTFPDFVETVEQVLQKEWKQ